MYRTPHFNQYLHSSLSSTKSTYCNMMISLQGDQNPYLWIIHIYLSCRSQNRSVFQCAQHKETSHQGIDAMPWSEHLRILGLTARSVCIALIRTAMLLSCCRPDIMIVRGQHEGGSRARRAGTVCSSSNSVAASRHSTSSACAARPGVSADHRHWQLLASR